jgi:hypothetical protein
MAAICARLERIGRSGSTQGAPELVAALEAEYPPVREALEEAKARVAARPPGGKPASPTRA